MPSIGGGRSAEGLEVVAPQRRDLEHLAGCLTGWLGRRLPEARNLRISNLSYPLGAGLSHETILFDAAWQESGRTRSEGLVVRIKPVRNPVFLEDLFEVQFQLMQLMHDTGTVPVAAPLWFEREAQLLGAPFFVMKKVSGRVAVSFPPYSKQGWLFDAAPDERRRLWTDTVAKLAAIQTVPVLEATFLGGQGRYPDGFGQELERWTRYLDWVDPRGACTLLRQVFERLVERRPRNCPEGLVWGDARLGNMMIGDDFQVTAVMDWEQPSLGGALQDLGWWLYTERMQTVERGLQPLPGMGTREETITLWREVCGKSASDIEWYEAFAAFKMDCLSVRLQLLDALPPAARDINPGMRTARMLEAL